LFTNICRRGYWDSAVHSLGPNSTWVVSLVSTRLDTFDCVEPVQLVVSSDSSRTVRQARHSQNAWVDRVERFTLRFFGDVSTASWFTFSITVCCFYFLVIVHVNFSSVFYRDYGCIVTSSRHRSFCFHNFVFLLSYLFVLYRNMQRATRISVCVIAVSKSHDFFLKFVDFLNFFHDDGRDSISTMSQCFSTTSDTSSTRRTCRVETWRRAKWNSGFPRACADCRKGTVSRCLLWSLTLKICQNLENLIFDAFFHITLCSFY